MKQPLIITFGREFCSGGAQTAKKAAELLGIPYYDKQIIDHAADIAKLSSTVVEQLEEKPVKMWMSAGYQYSAHWYIRDPELTLPVGLRIADAQFQAIEKLAEAGSCVIVGRCADYVLRQYPHTLNVFIRADLEQRIARACRLYGLEEEDAKKLIKKTDKIRADYYAGHTGWEWGSRKHHDLIINTARVGIDAAAELVAACARELQESPDFLL